MHSDDDPRGVKPLRPLSRLFSKAAYPLVAVIAVCAVYGQTLRFDFVTYDDYDLVYQNTEYLSDSRNVFTSFTTHVFATHRAEGAYYRPLLLISFIIDYRLWGLNPIGFHLMNVLLHAAAAILAYVLALTITRAAAVALTASLLFALHPVQTESVAWISGRNDILLAVWILLMACCFIRAGETAGHRKGYLALTGLFFAFALFTKESAAFYLLLLPLYELCFKKAAWRDLLDLRYLSRYFLPVALLALYLLVRVRVFGEVVGAERLYGGTPLLQRLIEIPAAFAEHCSLILVPLGLCIAHPRQSLLWFQPPWSSIAILVLLIFAAAVWRAWRRDPVICFGLLWFAVGILPVLNIFPLAVPVHEHRLYTPLAGAALAACWGGYRAIGQIPRIEPVQVMKIFIPASAAVIIIAAALSYARLPVWRDSATLWTDAIAKAPMETRSYFNLAGYYFDRGQYDKTIELLHQYIDRKPEDMVAYAKLRQAYFLSGRYEEAARICRRMIVLNPSNPSRYAEAAELFVYLHMPDSAIAVYQEGLRVDSNSSLLHEKLGAVYAVVKRPAEAEHECRRALKLNPHSASAHFGLATLYALRGEDLLSIQSIEEGMKYGKPPPDILQLLRSLYARTGQREKEQSLIREQRF